MSINCVWLCNRMECSPPGSSVHGDSPGKNTGVGCHALLQGIFPTQGSNPGLLHCGQILYQLSCEGESSHSDWFDPFSDQLSSLNTSLEPLCGQYEGHQELWSLFRGERAMTMQKYMKDVSKYKTESLSPNIFFDLPSRTPEFQIIPQVAAFFREVMNSLKTSTMSVWSSLQLLPTAYLCMTLLKQKV